MAANPYMLSGFADGFMKGYGLVKADQAQEFNQDMQTKEFGLKQRGATLAEQEAARAAEEHKEKMARMPTVEQTKKDRDSKIALEYAQADYARANTAETRGKMKDKDELKSALFAGERLKDIEDTVENIAVNMGNVPWLQQGERIDAFINHGMIDPNVPKEAMMKDIVSWGRVGLQTIIAKGLGETIAPETAKLVNADFAQKAPGMQKDWSGAKIINKELADVRIDDKSATAVMLLAVTVEKDGEKYTYYAPMTEGRTSKAKDLVLEIPLEKLEKMAQAGGMFASLAKKSGVSPAELPAWVRAQVSGGGPKKGNNLKITKEGVYDTDTRQMVYTYSNELSQRDLMNAAVKLYGVAVTEAGLTPGQIQEAAAAAKSLAGGLSGQPGATVAPEAPSNAGWSVTVVE